jgi:hypothetical protein
VANIAAPFTDERRPLDLAAPGVERRKPTLKLVGYIAAAVIAAALVLPFASDIYHRHQVTVRLWPLLSEQDRLAYRNWDGDAPSFNRAIYNRCILTNGNGSALCNPLRPIE